MAMHIPVTPPHVMGLFTLSQEGQVFVNQSEGRIEVVRDWLGQPSLVLPKGNFETKSEGKYGVKLKFIGSTIYVCVGINAETFPLTLDGLSVAVEFANDLISDMVPRHQFDM